MEDLPIARNNQRAVSPVEAGCPSPWKSPNDEQPTLTKQISELALDNRDAIPLGLWNPHTNVILHYTLSLVYLYLSIFPLQLVLFQDNSPSILRELDRDRVNISEQGSSKPQCLLGMDFAYTRSEYIASVHEASRLTFRQRLLVGEETEPNFEEKINIILLSFRWLQF
jgi:hypothetical protein